MAAGAAGTGLATTCVVGVGLTGGHHCAETAPARTEMVKILRLTIFYQNDNLKYDKKIKDKLDDSD